jgi:hypothetical protein
MPDALPDRIFLTCMGQRIQPGKMHMEVEMMMPGIPRCKYLDKRIARGMFKIPIIIAEIV